MATAGKRTELIVAFLVRELVKPPVADALRLVLAIDDTPTPRYGLHVQGAGVHHNPTPGPAGSPFVYGRVWVVLGLLTAHPLWGMNALPLLARLYIRRKDLDVVDKTHRPAFATKLELAVELMRWAKCWLGLWGKPLWVVGDGAYAKAPFLETMRQFAVTVVSRLRKDAALVSAPETPIQRRRDPGGTGGQAEGLGGVLLHRCECACGRHLGRRQGARR